MKPTVVHIEDEPLGAGKERVCYRHPEDSSKIIKLQRSNVNKQTRRELEFYRGLRRRRMDNFEHIPRYFGEVETNLGTGNVFELISDFDGSPSKSLWDYFQQGVPLSEFYPYLEELKRYMLANLVVFSLDMGRFNVLLQRMSANRARLVVIDGLGNHTAMNWPDRLPFLARHKIERRWKRFFSRLQHYSDKVARTRGDEPVALEPAYRKTG